MKQEVIIEIPKNSNIKYELEDGKIKVDRILYGSMHYPANYGYIENTLDWDGDPLDVLVFANESFLPTAHVPTRILGAMQMIDDGETDTKILAVIDVDPRFKEIKTIEDVPFHMLKEIKNFFENYKSLQEKEVKIIGFENLNFALKELKISQDLYKKYKHLEKEDFIFEMKKEHPEKYF